MRNFCTLTAAAAQYGAVERGHPLSCVWIETANPRQPLAAVWIDEQMSAFAEEEDGPPLQAMAGERFLLCA